MNYLQYLETDGSPIIRMRMLYFLPLPYFPIFSGSPLVVFDGWIFRLTYSFVAGLCYFSISSKFLLCRLLLLKLHWLGFISSVFFYSSSFQDLSKILRAIQIRSSCLASSCGMSVSRSVCVWLCGTSIPTYGVRAQLDPWHHSRLCQRPTSRCSSVWVSGP